MAKRVKFIKAARRHLIGKGHALAAMADAGQPTVMGNGDLLWIGLDDRGLLLEVIAFVDGLDPEVVVVKHVMPYGYRRKP
ncbi:MAG: hypothetical protein WAV45_02125 [Propionibacteriaceae bacterium]|nr:hypothetical protein [Micropruina sp.]HBX81780.1 hypothetical protein [Propionibacteriaceae bacterium]HBY24109.1 hypothetical protein [Propionibacteriaceae bacterium]